MQRPGPLQDLPLHHYGLVQPHLPKSGPNRINKRPLSPGGPSLYSPAKRRILHDEGIFSFHEVMKSPATAKPLAFPAPAHFSEIFASPASLARRLNFGVPKIQSFRSNADAGEPLTLDSTSQSRRNGLSPSPEFSLRIGLSQPSLVKGTIGVGNVPETDDLPSETPLSELNSCTPIVFTTIPREVPPPPDSRSEHFPGFLVHQDSHIIVMRREDKKIEEADADKEQEKENAPPRRKIRKSGTASTTPIARFLVTPLVQGEGVQHIDGAYPTSSDNTEHDILVLGTFQQTPESDIPLGVQEERKKSRRILKNEADGIEE